MNFLVLLFAIVATSCADSIVVEQTFDIKITRRIGAERKESVVKNVGIRKSGTRFIGTVDKATQSFWVQFPLDNFLALLGDKSESFGSEDSWSFEVISGIVFVFEKYDNIRRIATYLGVKSAEVVLLSFNEKQNSYWYSRGFTYLGTASETTSTGGVEKYDAFKISNNVPSWVYTPPEQFAENWTKYVYIYYTYEKLDEVKLSDN